MTEEKGWQVVFMKKEDGDITVVYTGKINMYEFIAVLEIEREKLKQNLIGNVK